MKLKQYKKIANDHKNNASFQREVWDLTWSNNSLISLVEKLSLNPQYWHLKELITPKDKILEAGCGYGQWVYRLSKLGFNVTGVDFAKKTINTIKKEYPELKVVLGNVEKLPFNKNSFNAYLSFGVIEHFENGPQKVLSEANRVLTKGGLLYLTVPYLNFFRYLRLRNIKPIKGEQFYQYLYSKSEVKKHIEEAGFYIKEIRYYDFINGVKKDFPFLMKYFFNEKKKAKILNSNFKDSNKIYINEKKPDFILQNFLYKLDSYVVLFEAYKI